MTEGWTIQPLGELCEFQRGLTYSKEDEVDFSDNVVLRATNIDLATNLLNFSDLRYISDGVRVPDTKKVKKDSLIICTSSGSRSHLGKVAFVDEDYGYAFGGFMGLIQPKSKLLPKYLFYLLTSERYSDFLDGLSGGTNINNLKFSDLKQFPVPCAPFLEQQRIVYTLDRAFEAISVAEANAARSRENSRAVFDSRLAAVFGGHREGWAKRRLSQIGTIQTGSTPSTSEKANYGDFIPFIKPADFEVDGSLNYRNGGLSEAGLLKARKVGAGSVLMVCIGATIGKCGYCDRDVTTNQQVNSLTPHNAVLCEFLYYQMLTKEFQLRLLLSSAQATLPIINKSKWSALEVGIPSTLDEQRRVVAELKALFDETQRLESIYQRKLAALEALKQSLLHQAFTGQLGSEAA